MSAEPQLLHPVLELLGRRASSRSRPGRRSDGARVALVIEGSGARSVVSCAMAAALEQAGLTPCFDLVVGSSAGALVGAAFVANVAGAYTDALCGTSTRLISPFKRRFDRRAVDAVLHGLHDRHGAEGYTRALASPIELHCIATDVATAESADLTGSCTVEELREALLAATRAPSILGQPFERRGRRYLDGALVEAIPLRSALAAGATHCLVLVTDARGARSPAPRRLLDGLVERKLRRVNPRLVDRRREHATGYAYAEDAAIVARAGRRRRRPFVLTVRPPGDAPVVHHDERRGSVLQAAADASLLEALHTVVEAVRLRRAFVPASLEEHDRAAE